MIPTPSKYKHETSNQWHTAGMLSDETAVIINPAWLTSVRGVLL